MEHALIRVAQRHRVTYANITNIDHSSLIFKINPTAIDILFFLHLSETCFNLIVFQFSKPSAFHL